jgi:hypothetical protein
MGSSGAGGISNGAGRAPTFLKSAKVIGLIIIGSDSLGNFIS